MKPTVFTGVNNDMQIAREEIFGPVATAIPFKDENDAVFQGNDTDYGLAAAVWTRDISRAHKVARALKAGTVWVNCYNQLDPISPVRRLQAVRLRPRARQACAGALLADQVGVCEALSEHSPMKAVRSGPPSSFGINRENVAEQNRHEP